MSLTICFASSIVTLQSPDTEFANFWETRIAVLDNTPAACGFINNTHFWFKDAAGQITTLRCLNKAKASQTTLLYLPAPGTQAQSKGLLPDVCTLIYDGLVKASPIPDVMLPTDAQPLYKATVDCLRLLQSLAGSDRFITGRLGIIAEAQAAPVALALAALAPEQVSFLVLHEPCDSMTDTTLVPDSLTTNQLTRLAVAPSIALSGEILAADTFAPCLLIYSIQQETTALNLATSLGGAATTCLLESTEYTPLYDADEALKTIKFWVNNGDLPGADAVK